MVLALNGKRGDIKMATRTVPFRQHDDRATLNDVLIFQHKDGEEHRILRPRNWPVVRCPVCGIQIILTLDPRNFLWVVREAVLNDKMVHVLVLAE